MKKNILSIAIIILAVIWVCVIFFMSSQTSVNSSQMSRKVTKVVILLGEKTGLIEDGASKSEDILKDFNIKIRKLAHIGMYFFLTCIMFAFLWKFKVNKIISVIISFCVSTNIAIIDEINQMNYIGRNSGVFSEGISDIYKDLFGIGMALVLLLVIRIIKETRSKKVQ
jgi:VanZ family protein